MSAGLIGLKRQAKIIGYNDDGTVTVRLQDGSDVAEGEITYIVPLPIAWGTVDGGFVGGFPQVNTAVLVEQGQGGWYISGYDRPDNSFINQNVFGTGGIDTNYMGELTEGRILLQTAQAQNRLYLDPEDGIVIGDAEQFLQLDNNFGIVNTSFDKHLDFSFAHREITGTITRDINFSSVRDVEGQLLNDDIYEPSFWEVGMDPSTSTATITTNNLTRNLPLTESRQIVYEFANYQGKLAFTTDKDESDKYSQEFVPKQSSTVLRTDARTTAFNLNLHYPNHLIEEILGTGVDIFGNILDINRSILPLGRTNLDSFDENEDSKDAFRRMRNLHRRSLAYHFEINARKQALERPDGPDGVYDDPIFEVPVSSNRANNARSRSTFAIDIDKEGQFKINVPASSESGNIPLTTRSVNSSVLAFEDEKISDPNAFFLEEDSVDIYLENFSNYKDGVVISSEDGDTGSIDRFTGTPIRLTTPYHDITKAGYQFTKKRLEDDEGGLLVRYMPSSHINQVQDTIQYDDLLSSEIFNSGPKANSGGRSGTMSLDGSLNLYLGANTVDRQSLWIDTLGGVVSQIGRDRRGISYLGQFDGDVLMQVGGSTPAFDSRFEKENKAGQPGVIDLRILGADNVQLHVIRIDKSGVTINSSGRVEIASQQDLVLRSNSNINLESPNINMYYDGDGMRTVKRNGSKEI